MCDSFLFAPNRTARNCTLFAKNSDRKPGESQPLLQFPAARYPNGSPVRCTHIEIPQVRETYRVMGHSPYWQWGFEHGVNEFRVAIGNHTVFSKEPVSKEPGLIGMDLVRLGLERSRSASEALVVITALLERHGQGGAAFGPQESGYHNSFSIADSREAWLLETSGQNWVARRVEESAVSNHYAIGSSWDAASKKLLDAGRTPNQTAAEKPLNFAADFS